MAWPSKNLKWFPLSTSWVPAICSGSCWVLQAAEVYAFCSRSCRWPPVSQVLQLTCVPPRYQPLAPAVVCLRAFSGCGNDFACGRVGWNWQRINEPREQPLLHQWLIFLDWGNWGPFFSVSQISLAAVRSNCQQSYHTLLFAFFLPCPTSPLPYSWSHLPPNMFTGILISASASGETYSKRSFMVYTFFWQESDSDECCRRHAKCWGKVGEGKI